MPVFKKGESDRRPPMNPEARRLRVLALSHKRGQYRVAVARPDNAIWVFGGNDPRRLDYLQFVGLWPESHTSSEPTPREVAEAVAAFGRQRAGD